MPYDALIEVMARKMYERPWPGGQKRPWDDESEGVRNRYRSMCYAAWPLVVGFVAEWLDRYDNRHDVVEMGVIDRWREEMHDGRDD